jgi:energy-coupling factor transporter ATP-binding protein EcfA2
VQLRKRLPRLKTSDSPHLRGGRGGVISVVGPDGSGKTTLIDALTEGMLASARVQMIRNVGIMPRRHVSTGLPVPEPHKDPPYPAPLSLAKTGYLFLDYVLGWTFKVRPFVRSGGWMVIQRGWWDLAVDPKRYRLSTSPKFLAFLGKLLPQPELLIILEAPPDVVYGRKNELTLEELKRQTGAWHELIPARQKRAFLDASQDPEAVRAKAEEHLAQLLDEGKRDTHFVGLPRPRNARFILPSRPGVHAAAAQRIYHPVTVRGLIGWQAARALARAGFLNVARATEPPDWALDKLARFIPTGGTTAFARTNHPGRYVALLIGVRGDLHGIAKIAGDPFQSQRLSREAENLMMLGPELPPPLAAPEVIESSEGLLLLAPVPWIPRTRAWTLPRDVAFALGRFHHRSHDTPAMRGNFHGDFAPWNLLRTREDWTVIDWEEAGEGPPFFDLFHFLVQGHALLGRPTTWAISRGLAGEGWVGGVIGAYCDGARVSRESVGEALRDYLETSLASQNKDTADGRRGIEARERLLLDLDLPPK